MNGPEIATEIEPIVKCFMLPQEFLLALCVCVYVVQGDKYMVNTCCSFSQGRQVEDKTASKS